MGKSESDQSVVTVKEGRKTCNYMNKQKKTNLLMCVLIFIINMFL